MVIRIFAGLFSKTNHNLAVKISIRLFNRKVFKSFNETKTIFLLYFEMFLFGNDTKLVSDFIMLPNLTSTPGLVIHSFSGLTMNPVCSQVLNLTQALKDGKSPSQLVKMPPVVVERRHSSGQGRMATLGSAFTQTFHCKRPFFSSW